MDNLIIDKYGNKLWGQHDKLHRDDGPAIEYADGDTEWYQHGKLHRDDGPAIEWSNGRKSWYQHGNKLSFGEWLNQHPFMTYEEKIMFKLKYG
jgi:hypothetical protein